MGFGCQGVESGYAGEDLSTSLVSLLGGISIGRGGDGVGGDIAFEKDGRWWFRLVTIVGRTWAALEAFAQIQAQYNIPGPVQFTLGFNDTEGASLSQVGAGWNQYWDQFCCRERRFAHVLEMDEGLSSASAKTAAVRLGSRIEESFGSSDLRFLDREGDRAGEFASRTYTWR